VGWPHHMALSLVALWFLCVERPHVGGKTRAITVPQARHFGSPPRGRSKYPVG
jgi:hypothetical protein